MAKKKPKSFVQPFPRRNESIGNLAGGMWRPVFIGKMSPELEHRLTEQVLSHVDSLAVENALRELCETFCIRLPDQSMQVVGYRAITGLVCSHNQNPVNSSEMTEVAIRLLPHCLSEVLIGLAVVHADWRLLVHAPALTYFSQLILFRRLNFPLYPGAKKPSAELIPSEFNIRESETFAYALGRIVREHQTISIPIGTGDDVVISIGNAVIAIFVEYFEGALRGVVNLDDYRRDVEDGLGFTAHLHELMQYGVGREAAEPMSMNLVESGMDFRDHPAIARGIDSQKALDDAQLREEFRHMLVNALSVLSPRQLQAWYFRFVVRLSDDAAAVEMKVHKNTFREHLDRAVNHFEVREYAALVCRVAHCTENSKRFLDLISSHLSIKALSDLVSLLQHCRMARNVPVLEDAQSEQLKPPLSS